jgi:CheY-like chemotaxis protein
MSGQPRILVIEDEIAIQELLRYSLEQAAFEVVVVGPPAAARGVKPHRPAGQGFGGRNEARH